MVTHHVEEFLAKAGLGTSIALCAVLMTLLVMAIWDKAL